MRGATVVLSPVFGVPVGSISKMWTSLRATGRCSTPLGTTNTSPGRSVTVAVPQLDVERSMKDKKKIGCLVMFAPWNGPSSLATMMFVVIVSGNSAGREAIRKLFELFGEIGPFFHHSRRLLNFVAASSVT